MQQMYSVVELKQPRVYMLPEEIKNNRKDPAWFSVGNVFPTINRAFDGTPMEREKPGDVNEI